MKASGTTLNYLVSSEKKLDVLKEALKACKASIRPYKREEDSCRARRKWGVQ